MKTLIAVLGVAAETREFQITAHGLLMYTVNLERPRDIRQTQQILH